MREPVTVVAGPPVFAEAEAGSYARHKLVCVTDPWFESDRMQPFRERDASYSTAVAELGPVLPVGDSKARRLWLFRWVTTRLFGRGKGLEVLKAVAACRDTASLDALMHQPESKLRKARAYGNVVWSATMDVQTKLPALLRRRRGGVSPYRPAAVACSRACTGAASATGNPIVLVSVFFDVADARVL